jgi:hypothetical protein
MINTILYYIHQTVSGLLGTKTESHTIETQTETELRIPAPPTLDQQIWALSMRIAEANILKQENTPPLLTRLHRCDDCAICQETNANAASRINACGHTFHTACIRPWLDRNPTCPMCRAAVA